ncbi:MAG: hypothetical protein QXR65_03970 [Candidatus Bathyarchaeia archaeon]|nr:hypothetical protein [Candidatus Bathyarchaeota archaeon]
MTWFKSLRLPSSLVSASMLALLLLGVGVEAQGGAHSLTGFEPAEQLPAMRGLQSIIVIPVAFRDLPGSTSLEELRIKVFTQASDYLREVSGGSLTISGDVAPRWYELSRSYKWYGEGRERWENLVWDAVKAADKDVNYLEYDHVMIVHAGDNQDKSFREEDITSFASQGRVLLDTRDGKLAAGVSCLAEMDPLGPYVRYLLQSMGLPNLYVDGYTVGEWCLMAHGFWAHNGSKPVHPCAWTMLRAGWLPQEKVREVPPGGEAEILLTPLEPGYTGDVKAVRIPLGEKTYYLVEARRRVGWDEGLPGEGILISYIDEAKKRGIVRIVDGGSSTPGLEDAPLQPGGFFENSSAVLTVEVLSSTPKGYMIRIDRTGRPTRANLTVQTGCRETPVWVDGAAYTTGPDGSITLEVRTGPHQVRVEKLLDHGNGTRSTFREWSDGASEPDRMVEVEAPATRMEARYSKEHKVEIISPYGMVRGEGWYPDGDRAVVSVEPPILDHGNGTRRVFKSWIVEGEEHGASQTPITVSGPMRIEALWTTEYNLTFKVEGLPEGSTILLTVNGLAMNYTVPFTYSGWYPRDAAVEFRVEPESETVGWITYTLKGYVDDEGGAVAPPIHLDGPTIISVVYAGGELPQPPKPRLETEPPGNLTDAARGFLEVLSRAWRGFLQENRMASRAYNETSQPVEWALAQAESIYSSMSSHPTPAILSSAVFVALVIGLIYAAPLAAAVALLGTWRLRWKPSFRKLIAPTVLLILGVILAALAALYHSPMYTAIGWGGVILTGIATAYLVAAAVAVAASKPLLLRRRR